MKQAKQKRWSAMLLMVILCFTMLPGMASAAGTSGDNGTAKAIALDMGYRGEALPKAPVKNGNVWIVTPENAQYTLDGAYGSINGKTIHFGKGVYSEELVLARSTKYAGSNTVYYNKAWNQASGKPADVVPVDVKDLNDHSVTTYMRTIENVKLSAEDGVILPGFSAASGHVYQNAYDYVREIEIVNTNRSYYMSSSIKNLTFDGLTIQNRVEINDYILSALNSGIHFQNCTFKGNKSNMGTASYGAIRMMADDKYFENVTISHCTITNYFQGVQIQGAISPRITNNVFDGTRHNAIALQSSTANTVQGVVLVAENIIRNAKDRAIRFGRTENAEQITVKNNIIVNSGDGDGELLKGVSFPDSTKVSLEHNYWDGRDVATAVANADIRPEKTGIVGGSFPEEVKPEYCGEGFVPTANKDGTYGVCNHEGAEMEVRNKRKPTCIEKGYTGDTYCANCGTLIAAGKEIETTSYHANKWMSDADAHWYECVDCGVQGEKEAHTFEWIIDKEATNIEEGSKHEECFVCGYKREAVEIPVVEVQAVEDPATETIELTTNDSSNSGTNNSLNSSTNSSKTGDNSNLTLWIALLFLAASGFSGTIVYLKRRRTRKA